MTYFIPDLTRNANSFTLVLSGGSGQVQIPDEAQKIGILTGSTSVRLGLNAIPQTSTSSSGSLTASAFKRGMPISGSISGNGYTWFDIGGGTDRVLYFIGGATDSIVVIYT